LVTGRLIFYVLVEAVLAVVIQAEPVTIMVVEEAQEALSIEQDTYFLPKQLIL
jgi:hypothetical protein